jgi:hypothetical protein
MRFKSLVLASILLAALAYAKEPKAYQSGKLVQMNAEQCGVEAKGTENSADDSGIGSDRGQTPELLCGEYLLQADEVVYRIRPKHAKHAALLPIGEWAQFRLEKDKMLLRAPHFDGKEREYVVVSMTPRGESSADAHPVRLNHLQ